MIEYKPISIKNRRRRELEYQPLAIKYESTKLNQQKFQESTVLDAADISFLTEDVLMANGKEKILRGFMKVFLEELHDEEHTLTIHTPRTWWQHFKKTYFGPRLLRWFPVQYDVHTRTAHFKAGAYYPKLKLPFDSQVKYVQSADLYSARKRLTDQFEPRYY